MTSLSEIEGFIYPIYYIRYTCVYTTLLPLLVSLLEQKPTIDSIDLKIIEQLTKNARKESKAIAETLGISDRTVARRMENLEKLGIIKGYSVVVNEELLRSVLSGEELPRHEREIHIGASEWNAIRDYIRSLFGIPSSVILFHLGLSIGKELGRKLISSELDRENRCLTLSRIIQAKGWGRISYEHVDFEAGEGRILLTDSPFISNPQVSRPSCDEIRGILAGFLESVFDRKTRVSEEMCVRKGDDHCQFTFEGPETKP